DRDGDGRRVPQDGGGSRLRSWRQGNPDDSRLSDRQGLALHRLDAARPREGGDGRGRPHRRRHDCAGEKGWNFNTQPPNRLRAPASLFGPPGSRGVGSGMATTRTRSTTLIVSTAEYERLTDLANASMERLPAVAQELLDELERAQIVADKDVPKDVVRMGSTVTFKSDDGHTRTLKLVYPADESLDDHRISIMTPVGAALIGLGTGQSISWT